MAKARRDPEEELRERARGVYGELAPQQRAVVDHLLAHVRELGIMGGPEVATRCGVSEATVVRVAQRLGYDGFRGLRKSFEASLRAGVAPALPPALEALAKKPGSDSLGAVAQLEIANVERTVAELDRRALVALADALFEADHTYVFGVGISAHLAELLVYLLAQIGVRASVISTRFSSPLEALASVRRGDLLVVLSFPPYSRPTLALAREAERRGILRAAITDRAMSPAARASSITLAVRSENMMFTNAIAALSVVMNALVTEAALRHRDRSSPVIARIDAALKDLESDEEPR